MTDPRRTIGLQPNDFSDILLGQWPMKYTSQLRTTHFSCLQETEVAVMEALVRKYMQLLIPWTEKAAVDVKTLKVITGSLQSALVRERQDLAETKQRERTSLVRTTDEAAREDMVETAKKLEQATKRSRGWNNPKLVPSPSTAIGPKLHEGSKIQNLKSEI